MSVHSNASVNTLGPSFQIDLQSLIKTTDLLCGEDDSKQVANVIKRHMSALKKVIASQLVSSWLVADTIQIVYMKKARAESCLLSLY